MLEPFQMLAPSTVEEAVADLERLDGRAHLYAGGVELALLLSTGALAADYLVDVKRIGELRGIAWDGTDVRIGAATTHQEVADHAVVRERLPALAAAESALGNVRVRHQGTIGGNVALRYSHSDVLPALLVYEARVDVADRDGRREVPVAEFLAATPGVRPLENDLLRGTVERVGSPAIVVGVAVPPLGAGWVETTVRSERLFRPPDVGVALALQLSGDRIEQARVALGCTVPHARRLSALEAALAGVPAAEAARIVADRPGLVADAEAFATDLAGSAEYKAHLATVLVRRALERALEGGK
jgi:carbon-monoxide dehydrogenase medium subunit